MRNFPYPVKKVFAGIALNAKTVAGKAKTISLRTSQNAKLRSSETLDNTKTITHESKPFLICSVDDQNQATTCYDL